MKQIKFVLLGFLIISIIGWAAVSRANLFVDVMEGSWYEDSLRALEEIEIFQGDPHEIYHPDDDVNRAELAVVVDRLIEYIETGEVSESALLGMVRDVPLADSVLLDVPFTAQAPYGDWSMPYQEACEEASIIMVRYYWEEELLSAEAADEEIVQLVGWEEEHGYGVDVDAQEIVDISREYYGLQGHVYYYDDVTLENIRHFLAAGYPVIVPAAGQTLDNINYTDPGPPYHMIVIVGYDGEVFISNDPGTQFGENYRYSSKRLDEAIHDWNGAKTTIDTGRRAMVVLSP